MMSFEAKSNFLGCKHILTTKSLLITSCLSRAQCLARLKTKKLQHDLDSIDIQNRDDDFKNLNHPYFLTYSVKLTAGVMLKQSGQLKIRKWVV